MYIPSISPHLWPLTAINGIITPITKVISLQSHRSGQARMHTAARLQAWTNQKLSKHAYKVVPPR